MADLTLHTNPKSRGRIARWMLEEVGAPYGVSLVQYGPTMKGPEFLRLNPMGKIPVLVHGETVVTETAAICLYLADAFPQAQLAPPPGSRARGDYYRWSLFAAGPMEAAIINGALGVEVPDARRGMVGYGSLPLVMDTVEAAVSGTGFLAGEAFSTADLLIAAQLGFGMMFGTVEKRPAFEAYVARMDARPAAQRARALDDALIAAEAAQASSVPS